MDILKNKKGSTTILTAVVIGTVLMLVISLVELTKVEDRKRKDTIIYVSWSAKHIIRVQSVSQRQVWNTGDCKR